MPGLNLAIGPKGGLGDHGDAVPLQLILTKASLVERRIDNYEVSWQHIFDIIFLYMTILCCFAFIVLLDTFFLLSQNISMIWPCL